MKKQIEKQAPRIRWTKIVALILGIAVAILLISMAIGVYNRVSSSWQEVQFAYNKTEVVRTVRIDYENKISEIEKSYKEQELTPEQKLIEEVVDQMKTSK